MSNLKEDIKLKFNEVVTQIYKMSILPHIQSQINERIPKQVGFTIFESEEFENYILSLITSQQREVLEDFVDFIICTGETHKRCKGLGNCGSVTPAMIRNSLEEYLNKIKGEK